MENKKDIGKAFREKLEGLEKSPKDTLWAGIEAELNKKKKRRVVPFFWFATSATAIALLVTIGVFTKPIWKENFGFDNNKNLENIHNVEAKEIVLEENKKATSTKESTSLSDEEEDAATINLSKGKIKNSNAKGDNQYSSSTKELKKFKKKQSQENNNTYTNRKRKRKHTLKKEKTVFVFNNNNNNNNNNNTSSDDTLKSMFPQKETDFVLAQKSTEEKDTLIELKKEKTIEIKMLRKKKSDSIAETDNGVYVFVHGSPTLFRQTSKKSPFDTRLDGYGTTSEIVFNYGGYIGFNGSEKWSARIGINSAQLNLKTDNIQISTLNGNPIISGKFNNVEQTPGLTNEMIASKLNDSIISLSQKLSYLEIPMEFKYKFYTQNNFQFDAIAGFSILYLKQNDIIAESRKGNSMEIGTNSFLKSLSMSANLGVGISYKLNKKLQINVEPIFKYYFNDAENEVKTYSLNLQAGLQYTFQRKK